MKFCENTSIIKSKEQQICFQIILKNKVTELINYEEFQEFFK